jgi:hypothetical protein
MVQKWQYLVSHIGVHHTGGKSTYDTIFEATGCHFQSDVSFCKDFTTIVELKEAYVLYCPRTFTYDNFVGMEDEEEMEPVEDDGGEQAKEAHVAAKIKEFVYQTSSPVDDDENNESKKDYMAAATDNYDNDESKKKNDDDNDDGVDDVLLIVTKGENVGFCIES